LRKALPELAPAEGGEGRIALTFEIIYGHAFKPTPRVSLSAESAVSLREMRAMLQRGRPPAH
jgi:malonyl-CoA O-methyltransferase